MHKISIYEMLILHDHFSKKSKPTKEDRAIVKKIDDHLRLVAGQIVTMRCAPVNLP